MGNWYSSDDELYQFNEGFPNDLEDADMYVRVITYPDYEKR